MMGSAPGCDSHRGTRRRGREPGASLPRFQSLHMAWRHCWSLLQQLCSTGGRRQRSRSQPLSQRLTFEEFRYDERRILKRADVENGKDVRVIQRAGGARFLLKSAEAIRT